MHHQKPEVPSKPAISVLQERYEKHHQCVFDADALPAAVTLSSRYIPDRYLPDKAIDVMDEAASRVRLQAYETRRAAAWPLGRHDIEEWEILVQVLDAKDEAVQVSFLHHQPSICCILFNATMRCSSHVFLQHAFIAAACCAMCICWMSMGDAVCMKICACVYVEVSVSHVKAQQTYAPHLAAMS